MGGKHKKNNKVDHHQKSSSSSSKNSKINKRNHSNNSSSSSSSNVNSNASLDTTDNDHFYNEKRHFQKKKRKNNYKKQTVNDIDFEKLDGQLKPLGLYLHSIEGDGNCMFRAISDQLTQSENKHMEYRERCVRYMRMNREEFEPFVLFGGGGGQGSRHDSDDDDDEDIGGGAMRDFSSYCDRMARDGVWGGNVELVAISHCEMINIVVHQLDAPKFEITSPFSPKRTIHLSYHMGSHYNSVRAVNERVMEMHNTHGTVYSEMQKKVQIVMSSVMPTVKSNESNKSRKKSSKNASSSSVVVVDEAYVRQVLQQNDMDTDSAIDFIIMEQQMVREDHRDTQPQYDDENEELSAQDQVYIMQVREYVGDGIPDHIILETLKNSRYQLDLVVEQLMNQAEVYTYESSSPPSSSASTSTRKSGSSSSCVSSSSSSSPPPKMTKKEKKELKRKQKMKERAAEVMSEARSRSHTTDSTTITTDDFDLSEEELVKLISQTSSVRI